MSLVRERGLYGIRVEDITERCDVAKGAFYLHFESKAALFAELLARAIALLERECMEEVKGQGEVEQRIRAVVRAHVRFLDSNVEYALLLHQGRGILQLEEKADSALATVYRDYLTTIAAIIFQDQGISAAHRQDLAALVAGAIAGHRSFRVATGAGTDGSAVEELLALALPVLAQRPDASGGRG
jgi:AcrR family transcriptional regulator